MNYHPTKKRIFIKKKKSGDFSAPSSVCFSNLKKHQIPGVLPRVGLGHFVSIFAVDGFCSDFFPEVSQLLRFFLGLKELHSVVSSLGCHALTQADEENE